MSYTICYDRRFIRSGLGITPLWLAGSNNCTFVRYDSRGRRYEVRERDWAPMFGAAGVSEEALMREANTFVPSTYGEHFRRDGKWVDDAAFLHFVENGIKNAITIEEFLKAIGVKSMDCYVSIWGKSTPEKGYMDANHSELKACVSTTQELDEWIKKARQRKDAAAKDESVFLCFDPHSREPVRIGRVTQVEGPVIVRYGRNCYISKATADSVSFTGDPNEAAMFASVDEALAKLPDWYTRDKRLCFVSAANVLKKQDWTWGVRVASGYHQGRLVRERTPRSVRFAYDDRTIRRFPTQHSAQKYADALNARNWQGTITFEAVNLKEEK